MAKSTETIVRDVLKDTGLTLTSNQRWFAGFLMGIALAVAYKLHDNDMAQSKRLTEIEKTLVRIETKMGGTTKIANNGR